MSGDFDKEAERERLREKYDSKAEDRAVTERMSQLLLQGATMTNQHCDTCGSPIFRYQGQEFCPTCQAEADAGNGESAAQAQSGTAADRRAKAGDASDRNLGEREGGDSGAGEREGGDSGAGEREGGDRGAGEREAVANEAGTDVSDRAEGSVGAASTGTAELGGATRTPSREGTVSEPAGNGPAAARRSLAETVTALSDRARETEDPHRAKALLEAAREAAETMAALEGE